ncbi:DUF6069 family protein [Actinomycetota bacterium Odt1-20B]
MTATTALSAARTTRTSGRVRSFLAAQPVWRAGVLAALAGALVTEVYAQVMRALGVPMKAASPGADAAEPIPNFGFASGVLFWAVVGVVLAVALARWAERPARTFTVTTVVLTALSLAPPFMAPHTAVSTQIVLAVAHLVAAAVIVPAIAVRLAERPTR